MNILFYSRDCDTCRKLLTLLQNENLLNFFKLFCVDDNLNKLPIQIKVVPTMIINTINKPLIAKETFEWVQKTKFIKQKTADDNQKKIIQNNFMNMLKSNNGIIGWNDQEMNNKTDAYAYKEINEPLSQSFFGYKDETNHSILTAPESNSLNSNEQKLKIQNLKAERDKQDEYYTNLNKKKQLMTLMENKIN